MYGVIPGIGQARKTGGEAYVSYQHFWKIGAETVSYNESPFLFTVEEDLSTSIID